MSNRRNYNNSSSYGGFGGSGNSSRFNNSANVNPWQTGSSPNRGTPSLLGANLLSQLTSSDTQLALATQLLSTILPAAAQVGGNPPSLMSVGGNSVGGYGNSRFSGGGGLNSYSNDRYRRDGGNDRRSGGGDRNRRPPNDRNRNDRRAGGGRFDKNKSKPSEDDAEKSKEAPSQNNADAPTKTDEDGEPIVEKKEHTPMPGFENIPPKLFHCHVCGKTMWNDLSFDTHMKGRNHRNKMQDLDESYQVQTNLLRQIAAISLKLDEVRRGKRRPYPDQYCKMCDLHFNGMTMFAHRSTDEHQNLKRFIHPSCDMCAADFQMRLEYDEHLLTAPHLQEEAKALLRREKYENDPKYIELREQEAKFRLIMDEVRELKPAGSIGVEEEDEKLLEELGEEGKLPPYDADAEKTVGAHHVAPAQGFLCKICQVFVLSETAADVHCRTPKHYESYINALKAEATKRLKHKESAESKRKADQQDDTTVEDKRMKTDDEEVNGEAVADEKMETNEDAAEEANNKDETVVEEEEQPRQTRTPGRRGRGRGRK